MTREEASEHVCEQPNGCVVPIDVYDLIDAIYDDFESRTCDNCKHYYSDEETCYSDDVSKYRELKLYDISPKDFGCNKWESK